MNFPKMCVTKMLSQDELNFYFLNQSFSGKYFQKIRQDSFTKLWTHAPNIYISTEVKKQ